MKGLERQTLIFYPLSLLKGSSILTLLLFGVLSLQVFSAHQVCLAGNFSAQALAAVTDRGDDGSVVPAG